MTLAWPSDFGHLHQEQLLLFFLGAMLLGGGLDDPCAVSMPQALHYITHLSFPFQAIPLHLLLIILLTTGVGACRK